MFDLFDRKHSLPWLIALSVLTGGVGQALLLSAAPHQTPVRRVPQAVARRLAASLKPRPSLPLPTSSGPAAE